MKILPISDVHEDGTGFVFSAERIAPADVVVIAGDVADNYLRVGKWLVHQAKEHTSKQFLFIPGNHCLSSIRTPVHDVYEYFQAISKHVPNLKVLSAGVIGPVVEHLDEASKVAFIGDILWTDFALFGDVEADMAKAETFMWEYGRVWETPARVLRGETTHDWHQEMRSNLMQRASELRKEGFKVIVVTHHGPHAKSNLDGAGADRFAAAYCSNLLPDTGDDNIALWIHGHVHEFKDYQLGGTRVVHNPFCCKERDYRDLFIEV